MSELIPPDYQRCQAYKPNGQGPFTLGGGHKLVQCENKPVFVATENKPAGDGLIGSMSICQDCSIVFLKQMGADHATLTPIVTESV